MFSFSKLLWHNLGPQRIPIGCGDVDRGVETRGGGGVVGRRAGVRYRRNQVDERKGGGAKHSAFYLHGDRESFLCIARR